MNKRTAIVHDYLSEAGGAERVLKVLSEIYPEAPIYTAFAKKNGSAYNSLKARQIRESKWAPILKIGRMYSYLRFCLPWIWASLDLREYDVVITSCSGYIARGFKVKDSANVIAYCHTPPRWLYGYDTPTGAQDKWWGKAFMWLVGPWVRYFDFKSAQRVDVWIANSQEVAKRIQKFYRKTAIVVYPPVEINLKSQIANSKIKENYYLMVSRIVGGKGILEAARAFKQLGIKLKIVGEVVGTTLASQVECLGRVNDNELIELYMNAKGFVAFARDEDFGMTVVESMMVGTPVLAYNGGGFKETVVEGITGVLVNELTLEKIKDGLTKMEKIKWNSHAIQKWAAKFGRARFESEIKQIVGE